MSAGGSAAERSSSDRRQTSFAVRAGVGSNRSSSVPGAKKTPTRASTTIDLSRDWESEDVESTENVVYDQADLISGPILTEDCTVPQNVLQFQYSYGYDCQQHSNLCVLDENTLAFMSGNVLHFFQIAEKKLTFRRSAGGGGVGHIAKNPLLPHLAVGEMGKRPYISVFEWPSMNVIAVLKRGAREKYTHLNYSPDGELLCSVGGPPDNYFTVWNWRESRIMLRAKSSGQDVFQAAFSSHIPGHITSSGSAHVRFWRMAQTFTGLKLMGAQGRFGNTEVSDVIGVLAMPDGKVVSGCEWGNILLWEAGLIKVEVTKKGRKSCHASPITQFEYCNGELVTLGLDGFVKVWYFETIDLADPPDEDRYVEVEPIFELEVADELGSAALMCMRRQRPGDSADSNWVLQDAHGGLWLLDLSLATDAPAPRRLYTAHACGVVGMACAPQDMFVATLGKEGRLHVYCHRDQQRGLVIARAFPAAGTALLWLPAKVAPGGCVLVLAFADGVLRVVAVDLAAAAARLPQHGGTGLGTAAHTSLLQTAKAHGRAATALALSDSGAVLASGGADSSVFLFAVRPQGQFATLSPMGFVEVPDEVTFLTFKPSEDVTLLAGCLHGQVAEIKAPPAPRHDVSISLKYTEATLRTFTYKSVKSQIRRDQQLAQLQRQKDEALQRRKEQLAALRAENSQMEIDEEAFLEESEIETEMVLEPLFVPPELGAVRWLRYLDEDSVWLAVSGYDCGYLYEYQLGRENPEPRRSTPVPGGDDCDICSMLYYRDKQYVFLGMGDGVVRVARVRSDPSDLSDFWSLGMHHPSSGPVTLLCLSPDSRTLFSAAPDGNVFMYAVHPDGGDPPPLSAALPSVVLPAGCEEAYGADMATLEEQRAKAEHDRTVRAAAERRQHVEQALWSLADTYNTIIRRNRALPASQVIPHEELELDPRIWQGTQQALEGEAELLRRTLAYPLERACLQYNKLASFYTDAVIGHGVRVQGLRKDVFVETIRQRKLTAEFEAAKALAESKMEDAEQRGRAVESQLTLEEVEEEVTLAPAPVESFLRGISAFESKFNARLKRLLDKYHSRKFKRERRQAEWVQFMKKKPDLKENDPEDEDTIQEAVRTIGDYRLKSDPDYRVPPHLNTTTAKKYHELLRVRQQLDDLLTSFNSEVLSLRERKATLAEGMTAQADKLRRIHRELPPELRLQPPDPPTIDLDAEYPERKYQITEEDIEAEMEKTAPTHRRAVSKAPKPSQDEFLPEDVELEVLRGCHDSILEMAEGEGESWERLVEALPGSGELRRVDSEVDINTLMAMAEDDDVNTDWENERRAARLIQQVWQQQQLVEEMNRQVEALDQTIEALAAKRLLVQRDAALLRHRLLVLHQELIIIKACEDKENRLAARVAVKERERVGVQNQLNAIQVKMDLKTREILRCQEKEKEVQVTFTEAVADYQFIEYLKKVFKKKYKPPKASSAESSESSDSSSSSEEEEEESGSLESNEAGPLRFDDTACPPGCSQELFDITIRLRSQRHETERDVAELRRQVEQLRRDQEEANKKLKKAEEGLGANQEALEAFQREKQQRLNEVETIVILKLNQMQHIRPDGKFEQLKNTLVFNTDVLMDLDRRKQQLDEEAKAQRAKHKKNRTHLHRMMVDVAYMRERLRSLRNQIEDAQFRKFGCIVDVTEVEQALLKRFIWDLRSSADEIRAEFQGLIASIQMDVRKKFDELKRTIEQNTERQNLLLVLMDERNRLLKASSRRERMKETERPSEEDEDDADDDISKLQGVLERLGSRRDELLAMAVRLRQKGALPPISRPRSGTPAPVSQYHSTCGPEQIPPPPRPWPPACVTALKHPMYLGKPRRSPRSAPPGSPATTRSLMADRRAAVREQLEGGEQASVLHPHPTARRVHSLDSITQGLPGFLSADLREIATIPSEEELSAAPLQTQPQDGDEEDAQQAEETSLPLSESSVEELFRRVPSGMAQSAVEEFLERLGSQDGGEALLQTERRLSRVEGEDSSPPASDDEETYGLITSDTEEEEEEEEEQDRGGGGL